MVPGRLITSPLSLSISEIWKSLAIALTTGLSLGFGYFGFQNGPPLSPRFRNATSFIEWQAEQTSR